MQHKDGYIKFRIDHQETGTICSDEDISELLQFRTEVFDRGWIGVLPDGVGFGNLSMRMGEHFVITGNATGQHRVLNSSHFAEVLNYDPKSNICVSEGPLKPSSESGTHAVIYDVLPDINVILHIHNAAIWKKILETGFSTAENIEYGTPEMAVAVKNLVQQPEVQQAGVFAMKGHEDGVVIFGLGIGGLRTIASRIQVD
ncbi:MAG: class II aldolase/adducin family protein [Bacteroidales bacterium]|nr:class II aldolase/adducin family protein [Bacteroidales bacterium]